MLDDLKSAIGRASNAARDVAMLAAAIEYKTTNPDAIAVCAQISVAVGEMRDRLSQLKLAVLERAPS
jgi:hypothetical protein